MTDTLNQSMDSDFDRQPAGWLLAALQPAEGSPALRAACLQAVEAGRALARMRHANQRPGFSFLGIPAYLRDLADGAGASLDAVLRWAGLDLSEVEQGGLPGQSFTLGWGRLARAIGLGLREARWNLRLTFAQQPAGALALRRTPAGHAADEALLEGIAARLDKESRTRLLECEQWLEADYDQAAETER